MSELRLYSPAKVNLFLRILRRRADGFHELASLFQTISLFDELTFRTALTDQLVCTDLSIPTDGRNLIQKAIDLFRRKSGWQVPLQVSLNKRIPVEAGLGGGSGNAATALWACNEFCGRRYSPEELGAWASEIGSDVTFFLSHGTAYCTGRGEILQPLAPLPPQSLWIVKPPEGLSTAKVYGALIADHLPQRDPAISLAAYLAGRPDLYNDLEEPAFALMPSLADLKSMLQVGREGKTLMSGSGTSFFCLGGQAPAVPSRTKVYAAAFVNRPVDGWYLPIKASYDIPLLWRTFG